MYQQLLLLLLLYMQVRGNNIPFVGSQHSEAGIIMAQEPSPWGILCTSTWESDSAGVPCLSNHLHHTSTSVLVYVCIEVLSYRKHSPNNIQERYQISNRSRTILNRHSNRVLS